MIMLSQKKAWQYLTSIHDKKNNELGIKENYLNLIKSSYQKTKKKPKRQNKQNKTKKPKTEPYS